MAKKKLLLKNRFSGHTGSTKKTTTHFSLSTRKSASLLATILLVKIGDMCGNKTAKYLSQAHFCS